MSHLCRCKEWPSYTMICLWAQLFACQALHQTRLAANVTNLFQLFLRKCLRTQRCALLVQLLHLLATSCNLRPCVQALCLSSMKPKFPMAQTSERWHGFPRLGHAHSLKIQTGAASVVSWEKVLHCIDPQVEEIWRNKTDWFYNVHKTWIANPRLGQNQIKCPCTVRSYARLCPNHP